MNKIKPFLLLLFISVGSAACNAAVQTEPIAVESNIDPTALSNIEPTTGPITLPDIEPTTEPAAATAAQVKPPPKLPVIGPAPEFQNDTWINTESPLRLADLQGKVVLLEFWTFG